MTWPDPFAWRKKDAEVEDEIESHLRLAIQDRMAAGESPADAHRAARLELGNVPLVKEDARAVWRWNWVEQLRGDLIHGARSMRRQPGFTAVAVATLAIGIGANAAIFSLVNAVLLRPLLVADADRLVRFVRLPPNGAIAPTTSIPLASLLLQEAGVFRDVSAHPLDLMNLTGTPAPEQIAVARVTKDFFRLFGAPVLVGRTFAAEEDRPSGGRVAVLSHELWVRQFGTDRDIVGTSISLGHEPYIVVGVLGPGFDTEQFDQVPQLWLPFQLDPHSQDVGGAFCFVSAGLKPGVSLAEGNAQLRTLASNYIAAHPGVDTRFVSFSVEPVTAAVGRAVRASFTVLEVAVVLVLLIACANVANLLLMRGTGRAREMAVRAALGAGRGRLVRQLIAESLLLAAAGAVSGLALGFAGLRGLLLLYPSRNPMLLASMGVHLPRIGEHGSAVTLDWRVVAFTVVVSVLASVIAGFIPALQASRPDLQLGLKQTGGGALTGARHQARTRSLLVVTEVSLALMLLIGAGLLIRTSFALRAVKPGFDAQHVLTMRMSVSGTPFERRDGIARLTRDARERLGQIPGVEVASMACCMPLESVWQLPFVVQGRPLECRTV